MTEKMKLAALAGVAGALTAIGTGHVASPLAAVFAVFVWLRFFNNVSWRLGLAIFTALHTAAWELAYLGTVPLPAWVRVPMFAAFSLTFGLLFLVHTRAVRRWQHLLATLVLPCGWVIVEFATAALSPSGSWGSVAYTFLKWLPVAQLAAVTGWVGISFFIVWMAALADLVALRGIRTRAAARPAALGFVVILAVVAFGAWRIADAPVVDRQVPVLAVHGPTIAEVEGGDILTAYYLGWGMDDDQRAQAPALAAAYRDLLFEQTAQHVGDAQLVVWSETLAWMSYDDEADWIERGKALARERGVMLAMGMSVFDPTRERRYLNKLVLIDDRGEVLWEFLKARPVPGAWHVVGDGVLPAADTRLGRVGGAICYDMDFPTLLRQAGRSGTELFLVPSFDDKRVRWMHVRMAIMRGIEQGFTMIRPTAFGVSVVSDPFGRVLAEKDAFAGGGFVMSATAPILHVDTIYTRIGDAFSWACLAVFGLIILIAFTAGTRSERQLGQ